MIKQFINLLVVILCLELAGCRAEESSDDFSSRVLSKGSDVFELSIEELTKYYDVSIYSGNPRVVEGYFVQKNSQEGIINLVDTWESNHDTAMEVILPEGHAVEDYSAVYCIVVDNTTTCDYLDDILVYYWLVQDK